MQEVRPNSASSSPERFDDGVYLHALEALNENDRPARARWKSWALIAALVVLVVALPLTYWWATGRVNAAPSLSLSVAPAGSDLLIAWAGGAQQSRSSKLRVRDGEHEEEFDLRPSYEVAGTLVYHPKTRHVHVVWAVDSGGRPYGKEADYQFAAVNAEPISIDPAGTAPVPSAKPAVTEQTRLELEHLRVHNRRMEALVKALKARQSGVQAQ